MVNQGTIFISALTSCTQGLWILILELPCKTDAARFLVSVGSKLAEVDNEDEWLPLGSGGEGGGGDVGEEKT